MILVTVIDTDDNAEAVTPEDALCAALTMGREAKVARATHGFDPRITFEVEGRIVRSMTLRALTRDAQ